MSADKLEQLKNTMKATQEAARRAQSGEQAQEVSNPEASAQAEDPSQKLKEQNENLLQSLKEAKDNYVRLFADFENFSAIAIF